MRGAANKRDTILLFFFASTGFKIRAANAGAKVNATKEEQTTAAAIVKANSLNNRPLVPPEKPTGKNTAINTTVVAITAKTTSPTPDIAAL